LAKGVLGFLRQLDALRARRGPYRFLIRRWGDVTDVDLAARVLGAECFERQLEPVALPVETLRSLLVIAPHQDDETIGAGGTLLLAQRAGVKRDVLFVTDGGSRGATSYAASPEEVVRIRDAEAEEVCARLGAGLQRLGIANARPRPGVADLDRLAGILEELDPQVILLPWLLDGPARHRMVHHLLWLAHRRRRLRDVEVWGYQVHNGLLPNGFVDITAVADAKRALIERYRSQLEHVRRYDHIAMGMSASNARFLPDYKGDPVERYVEIFFTLPLHEHLKLVESFYFRDWSQTYRGVTDVIDGMRSLHGAVAGGV
jgi:LmbE family N-acetylglucosaminyl deacetylase